MDEKTVDSLVPARTIHKIVFDKKAAIPYITIALFSAAATALAMNLIWVKHDSMLVKQATKQNL